MKQLMSISELIKQGFEGASNQIKQTALFIKSKTQGVDTTKSSGVSLWDNNDVMRWVGGFNLGSNRAQYLTSFKQMATTGVDLIASAKDGRSSFVREMKDCFDVNAIVSRRMFNSLYAQMTNTVVDPFKSAHEQREAAREQIEAAREQREALGLAVLSKSVVSTNSKDPSTADLSKNKPKTGDT